MYVQKSKSDRRGIPVDNIFDSSSISSITGETVQFYFNSASTLTADAGQAAGTIVVAKLANNHVTNKLNDNIGLYGDTSLSFTSTAFTTEVSPPPDFLDGFDDLTIIERLNILSGIGNLPAPFFTANGQYFVDYNKGVLYGKKASTQTTLTSTAYKVAATASSSIGGTVIVTQATAANLNAQVVGNVASLATDSGNPVKIGGVYNTSAPAPTNGQRVDLQMDSAGNEKMAEQFAPVAEDNTNGVYAEAIKPLATSTYSWTTFQNLGANATLNVKASSGNVKSLYCHNVSGAIRYIQLHNTATTPGGGAVPAFTFLVPIGGTVFVDGAWFGENGYNFSTGIAFACSTTEATYTAATATDHVTQLMYK